MSKILKHIVTKFNLDNIEFLVDILMILITIYNFILPIFIGNINFIFNNYALILSIFFMPGWVILRYLNDDSMSILEKCIIAFPLSFFVFGLFYTFIINYDLKFLFSYFYVIFSGILFLKYFLHPKILHNKYIFSKPNKFEICFIILISVLFILIKNLLYPKLAYISGQDVIYHYSDIITLLKNPMYYNGDAIWYHSILGIYLIFSNDKLFTYDTIFPLFSIILIYSFYIMSKKFLNSINKNLPILATTIFFLFSGFGWVIWLKETFDLHYLNLDFDILRTVDIYSYWDTSGGSSSILSWLYFRPVTLGYSFLLILLYMMINNNISKKNYIIITSFILTTINQVHLSETILFVLIFVLISSFKPNLHLPIRETFLSICIASFISIIIYGILYLNHVNYQYNFVYQIFIVTITTFSYLIHKSNFKILKPNIRFLNMFQIFVILLYSFLFIYWFTNLKNIEIINLSKIYAGVPLYFYPLLLGLPFLLTIFFLKPLIKKYYSNNIILLFIILFGIMFLAKFISLINILFPSIGNIPYNEKRLLSYVYFPTSCISSIIIYNIIMILKKPYKRYILIFLILMIGILSTALSIRYQSIYAEKYTMGNEVKLLLNYTMNLPVNIKILTERTTTQRISELIPYKINFDSQRYVVWPAKSPEFVLNTLFFDNDPLILFLLPEDLKEIADKYAESYLWNELSSSGKNIYDGPLGKIIQIEKIPVPLLNSNNVILTPDINNINYGVIYPIYRYLSLKNITYTSVTGYDENSIINADTVFVSSEESALELLVNKDLLPLKFTNIVIFSVDKTGDLYDNFFEKQNLIDGYKLIGNNTLLKKVYIDINNPIVNNIDNTVFTIYNNFDTSNITILNFTLLKTTASNNENWKYYVNFFKPNNYTNYDFISFDFYGEGKLNSYSLYFYSNDNDYFWYKFDVSWTGWKKVILPMRTDSRKITYANITSLNSIRGTPRWDSTKQIVMYPSSDNPNIKYNDNLQNFTFIKGIPIQMQINVSNANGQINKDQFSILVDNKITIGDLFGSNSNVIININNKYNSSTINISVKMPPKTNVPSTLIIKYYQNSTALIQSNYIPKKDVKILAYTDNKIPFIILKNYLNFNFYYINYNAISSSFEDGSIYPFKGSEYGSISIDTKNVYDGKYSYKHVSIADDDFTIPYDEIKTPINYGESTSFSVYAKGEKGGETVNIYLFWYDKNGNCLGYSDKNRFTLTTDWNKYSFITKPPFENVSYYGFRLDNDHKGQTVYWDKFDFGKENIDEKVFTKIYQLLDISSIKHNNNTVYTYNYTRPQNSFSFNNFNASGDVSINSPSGYMNIKNHDVIIQNNDHKYTFKNVTNIIPFENEYIQIKCKAVLSDKGYGFYTDLHISNASITFSEKTKLLIVYQDGTKQIIENLNTIIFLKSDEIVLRTPKFNITGNIVFKNIIQHGNLGNIYPIFRINEGSNMLLNNKISFNILYSDVFKFATDYSMISGPVKEFLNNEIFDLSIAIILFLLSFSIIFLTTIFNTNIILRWKNAK